MSTKQTTCKHCGQDIENCHPYRRGEWRDRGNNTHCPTPKGDKGQVHQPRGYPRQPYTFTPAAPVTVSVDEFNQLKRELSNTRYALVNMAPESYHRLLRGDYKLDSIDAVFDWERTAADQIIASIPFVVDPNDYEQRERAVCPLCQAKTQGWGDHAPRGWTEAGLHDHLTGYRGRTQCRIMKAATALNREHASNKQESKT